MLVDGLGVLGQALEVHFDGVVVLAGLGDGAALLEEGFRLAAVVLGRFVVAVFVGHGCVFSGK